MYSIINEKVWDEHNWPGKNFYGVVLKGKLPIRSEMFLFCSFIFRDTFGVVVGLLKSGVKTCVPQLSTIKTEFSRELKTIY